MSTTTARLRRRYGKYLPTLAVIIWLFIALEIIGIMNNLMTQHKQVRHEALVKAMKVVPPTPTPVLTDKQMILSLPNGSLVWEIYRRESSQGVNDACKDRGFYNGFGFGQDGNDYACFSSLKEVASKVSDWITDHSYLPVKTMLCYYNIGDKGLKMNDCDYAEKVLNNL